VGVGVGVGVGVEGMDSWDVGDDGCGFGGVADGAGGGIYCVGCAIAGWVASQVEACRAFVSSDCGSLRQVGRRRVGRVVADVGGEGCSVCVGAMFFLGDVLAIDGRLQAKGAGGGDFCVVGGLVLVAVGVAGGMCGGICWCIGGGMGSRGDGDDVGSRVVDGGDVEEDCCVFLYGVDIYWVGFDVF